MWSGLHELFSNGEDWFFTMEFVDGVPILDYIRGHRAVPERSQARRGRDSGTPSSSSSRGVCALHEAGIVHGDIKPPNVLVTAEGRVVLLDFGLVREIAHQPSVVAGTPGLHGPGAARAGAGLRGGRLVQRRHPALRGADRHGALHRDVLGRGVEEAAARTMRLPALPGVPRARSRLSVRPCSSASRQRRPSAAQIRERLVGAVPVRASARRSGDAAPASSAGSPTSTSCRRRSTRVGEGHRRRGPSARPVGHGQERPGPALPRQRAAGTASAVVLDGPVLRERVGAVQGARRADRRAEPLPGSARRTRRSTRSCRATCRCWRAYFPALRRVRRASGLNRVSAPGAAGAQELRGPRLARLASSCSSAWAARRHLVLWIDDLQWGDFDSVRVLRDLQRPAGAPRPAADPQLP